MELLKEIHHEKLSDDFKKKSAVSAVLFDEELNIPLIYVGKHDYHKLPGGMVKEGEDKHAALKREILEETGCKIMVEGILGKVIIDKKKDLRITNSCFYGSILEKGSPEFTEKEKSKGFELLWTSINDAMSKISNDQPKNDFGKVNNERDLAFLEKAHKLIDKHNN